MRGVNVPSWHLADLLTAGAGVCERPLTGAERTKGAGSFEGNDACGRMVYDWHKGRKRHKAYMTVELRRILNKLGHIFAPQNDPPKTHKLPIDQTAYS